MNLSQITVAQGIVPIGLQLKQQIKWLIASEHLRPGDLLPSVRDLSATLGIARNTVNAVYDELRDEGLLTMGRGRGTEVAETERVRELTRLSALLSLLDESFAAATREGFTPEEIAEAAYVRAQLLVAQGPETGAITLVECGDHEVDFYIRQIRALTGLPVRFLDLDSYRRNPALAGSFFVTSSFHTDLRELIGPEADVAFLGSGPDLKVILQVAQLPPGSVVGFVALSASTAGWMKRTVASAGVQGLELVAAGVRDAAADDLLARADAVYALPSVYEQALRRAPEPERVRRFDLVLDVGSQERLKTLVCCGREHGGRR
ncbi:MAG: GntR family transcriptional regulator [Bacillota bacterium]